MNRKILNIAIPAIVSNITVPLLALVDVGIAGHLGERAYIGAIALGGMFFNLLYLNFIFLRMSTAGLVAQAFGRGDKRELLQLLGLSLALALSISTVILVFQYPIERLFFYFLDTTAQMELYTRIYVRVLVWGAPAVLSLYVFYGWFVGVQNARYQMYIAVSTNVLNLLLSLFFVYVLKMGIKGVALGTVVSQYFALLLAIAFWLRRYGRLRVLLPFKELFNFALIKRGLGINRDIFFRTLCLVSVMSFFSYSGSQQGESVLAINTVLLQLFTLFSYFIDGFAYSGEALIGRYLGARDKAKMTRVVRLLFIWGALLAALFTLVYFFGGERFLGLLTNDKELILEAQPYFLWAVAIPFCSFAAFIWDGIYIGATAGRGMLIASFIAFLAFFLVIICFSAKNNNDVLWFAFLVFLFLRGFVQSILAPTVFKRAVA